MPRSTARTSTAVPAQAAAQRTLANVPMMNVSGARDSTESGPTSSG